MRLALALAAGLALAGPLAAQPLAQDAHAQRLRESLAAARSLAGPLEGSWRLSGAEGDLYELELIDRERGLEGAWRDLSRPGALDASGFVEDVGRAGGEAAFRFAPRPGAVVEVRLTPQADGAWAGELLDGGARRPVVLRRP